MNKRTFLKNSALCLLVAIVCVCSAMYFLSRPNIEIPDTFETGLDLNGNYSNYVKLLNRSTHKDTCALRCFLEQNNIYDAATYYHGWIIVQLMEKNGDAIFSMVLQNLDSNQVKNIRSYIDAGIDHCQTSPIDSFIRKYPKTFKTLALK